MTNRHYVRFGCIILALVAAWLLFIRGIRIETYKDSKVTAGEVRRLFDMFFLHVSRPTFLKVGGETYVGVRGLPPFYLAVPGSERVLFVTDQSRMGVVFHVVDLSSGEAAAISGRGSSFGWNIGSKRKVGEPMTEWVESASGDEIVLVSRGNENRVRTVLNTSKRVVERQEVIKPK